MADHFESRAALLGHADFENALSGTPYTAFTTGDSSVAAIAGEAAHPGIVQCSTGTGATQYAGILTGAAPILLGGASYLFEATVRIPTLSVLAQRYVVRVGLLDLVTAAPVDGAYFEYDESASANWRISSAANLVRTNTASSSAVPANMWQRLRILVNEAASLATYYVNGTSIGTVSANLPSGTGRETGIGATIIKSAGTTARTLDVDRIGAVAMFATPR